MYICDKNYSCCNYQYWDNTDDIDDDTKDCPHLIKVRPVNRGHWIAYNLINGHLCAECSQCHKIRIVDSFCSHCGATMNEDD